MKKTILCLIALLPLSAMADTYENAGDPAKGYTVKKVEVSARGQCTYGDKRLAPGDILKLPNVGYTLICSADSSGPRFYRLN